MTSVEKPIYLVAVRDEWLSLKSAPEHSVIAFGMRDDARRFAKRCAKRDGVPASLYRIVEYRFSGNVSEG